MIYGVDAMVKFWSGSLQRCSRVGLSRVSIMEFRRDVLQFISELCVTFSL